VVAVATVPLIVTAQEADGFDGYIQSGTCAAPTDALRVSLDDETDHDIEPYVARTGTGDETVVLGYAGAPGAPGFGFSAIYTDEQFSLVIADADGNAVACGDILQPDVDRFGEAGIAVVQLLPVGDADLQGVAIVERAPLERELDVTPTRVRVLLASGAEIGAAPETTAGFDGFIQGGTCEAPADRVRAQLEGDSDHDVEPFPAQAPGSSELVNVAYYGSAGVPGFGLATAYTDEVFSLVVTDADSADPTGCGDILEPDDDHLAEAGLALVQLQGVDDASVQGFALIERIAMERELDVTPTRVRIIVFAPPVTGS